MIQAWENKISKDALRRISECVDKKCVTEGDGLRLFEKEIAKTIGIKYVIGTTSGTAAIALALMGIGIKCGDEIIVPDMTFIATANAAHMVGATVIAAPVEKKRPVLDIDRIDEYVTDKTKAIITVDLNGRYAWSRELKKKYSKRGIYIIDDACQAFLSCNKKAGTEADIGCFSFGITKTVTTINGGAVVTNDQELYEKMRIMKTQGMRSVFDGDEYCYPGFNFKLMDVLAVVGIEQLGLVDDKIKHMNIIDDMYRKGIDRKWISFFEKPENEFSWMTDIITDKRDTLREILLKEEIVSRPMALPLHCAKYINGKWEYSSSDYYHEKVLFLPCGPDQPLENIEKVIEIINKWSRET